jgi:hypothetical protein
VKPATISIFQVCNKAAKGTTSVHSQQNARLQKHGRTEDPRKALHIDITENMLIIIGGNFNDSDKSKELHYALLIKLGLQDACGSLSAPSTYVRGTKCINHVYLSPDLPFDNTSNTMDQVFDSTDRYIQQALREYSQYVDQISTALPCNKDQPCPTNFMDRSIRKCTPRAIGMESSC